RRIGSRHRDATKTALIAELLSEQPFTNQAAASMTPLFSSGRVEILDGSEPLVRASYGANPQHQAVWDALGVRHTAIVPIVIHANRAFEDIYPAPASTSLVEAVPNLAPKLLPLVRLALDAGQAIDRAVIRSSQSDTVARSHWQVSAFPIDRADGARLGVGVFLSDVSEERRVARRLADPVARLDVPRTDGETQWIEVRGRVVNAADGTPRRMIGVVADITERRLMEEIKGRLLEREHLARLDAEGARERLTLLAEIGAELMSSLDEQSL